jgi:catalase
MQGFGVNSFRLINKEGKSCFVKFHWTPHLGTHSLVWDECLKLNGQDPDFHRRDLYEAIQAGAYPKWEFGVQIVAEEVGFVRLKLRALD